MKLFSTSSLLIPIKLRTIIIIVKIKIVLWLFKETHPNKKIIELITLTTSKMFWPILYTALTTIIAFLSLIFSEIKPIIDFGWMMTLGLITSFIITFTLLPSLINFMPKDKIFLRVDYSKTYSSLIIFYWNIWINYFCFNIFRYFTI